MMSELGKYRNEMIDDDPDSYLTKIPENFPKMKDFYGFKWYDYYDVNTWFYDQGLILRITDDERQLLQEWVDAFIEDYGDKYPHIDKLNELINKINLQALHQIPDRQPFWDDWIEERGGM